MSNSLRKWYAGPDAAISAIPAIEDEKPQKSAVSQSQPGCDSLRLAAIFQEAKPQKSAVSQSQSQKSQIAAGEAENFTSPDPAWVARYFEAVRAAYEEARTAWEAADPLDPVEPGRCVACRNSLPDGIGRKIMDGGRAYRAHDVCAVRLRQRRDIEAARALEAYGIVEPRRLPDYEPGADG